MCNVNFLCRAYHSNPNSYSPRYVLQYKICRKESMVSVMGCSYRICIVLRISSGITTLPQSSILLTIPVAFIYAKTPLFILITFLVSVNKGVLSFIVIYGLRIVKFSPKAPTAKIRSITKGAV